MNGERLTSWGAKEYRANLHVVISDFGEAVEVDSSADAEIMVCSA